MPRSARSKSTGSTTWILQRVSGVVLILLLLAHFWVHHFFIKDFYGPMNLVELDAGPATTAQALREINPLWGQHEGTYIAPVRERYREDGHYLSAEEVTGPTAVTLIQGKDRTEILRGELTDRERLRDLLGDLSPEATVRTATISPDQIHTERMINHGDVQARVSNIWWKVYNLLFLVLAIYHGLTGMWDVLLDYSMRPMVRFSLYGTVVTVGLLLFVVGVLIIVPMGL